MASKFVGEIVTDQTNHEIFVIHDGKRVNIEDEYEGIKYFKTVCENPLDFNVRRVVRVYEEIK